jgi:hypothetical protein
MRDKSCSFSVFVSVDKSILRGQAELMNCETIKVKVFRYKPDVALGVPGG